MEFPRWVYYRDGRALIVPDEAAYVALEPGHKDTPGKFLPPDHVGYVPDPDAGASPAVAPVRPQPGDVEPPAVESRPVTVPVDVEAPVVAPKRRGRPPKVRHADRD